LPDPGPRRTRGSRRGCDCRRRQHWPIPARTGSQGQNDRRTKPSVVIGDEVDAVGVMRVMHVMLANTRATTGTKVTRRSKPRQKVAQQQTSTGNKPVGAVSGIGPARPAPFSGKAGMCRQPRAAVRAHDERGRMTTGRRALRPAPSRIKLRRAIGDPGRKKPSPSGRAVIASQGARRACARSDCAITKPRCSPDNSDSAGGVGWRPPSTRTGRPARPTGRRIAVPEHRVRRRTALRTAGSRSGTAGSTAACCGGWGRRCVEGNGGSKRRCRVEGFRMAMVLDQTAPASSA